MEPDDNKFNMVGKTRINQETGNEQTFLYEQEDGANPDSVTVVIAEENVDNPIEEIRIKYPPGNRHHHGGEIK